MKKRIFAIPAAAAAIPVKPSNAEMIAKIKNEIAQFSILFSLFHLVKGFQ